MKLKNMITATSDHSANAIELRLQLTETQTLYAWCLITSNECRFDHLMCIVDDNEDVIAEGDDNVKQYLSDNNIDITLSDDQLNQIKAKLSDVLIEF